MLSICLTCNMPGLVSNSYPVCIMIYFRGLFGIEQTFRFDQSVAFHNSFVLHITSQIFSLSRIIFITPEFNPSRFKKIFIPENGIYLYRHLWPYEGIDMEET